MEKFLPQRDPADPGHPLGQGPPAMLIPPRLTIVLFLLGQLVIRTGAQEPPALNPFGTPSERPDRRRDDAVPGVVELSSGRVHPGQVSLTRDAKFRIFDEARKTHREIPLKAVRRIDAAVLREWLEPEWRFKENASDEKFYTGRSYPAREYVHTITLQDGQSIRGSLSGIVYVRAPSAEEPTRFLLHRRDKGPPGTELKDLVYVRSIRLGAKALEEAVRKNSTGHAGTSVPAAGKASKR